MSDTWVICPSCGDSTKADEFEEGVSLRCDDCVDPPDPEGQVEPPIRLQQEDTWNDFELERWASRRRRQRR